MAAECRWVITSADEVLVQYPDDNPWCFTLSDGDNSWAGGPDGLTWTRIADDDPRITPEHREAMGWLFDEQHDDGTEPRKAWYDR